MDVPFMRCYRYAIFIAVFVSMCKLSRSKLYNKVKELEKTNEDRGPQIFPNETIILNEGDNLTISCVGDKYLIWKDNCVPKYSRTDPNYLVTQSTNSVGRPFATTFHYEGVYFDSTGRYWCLHQSNPTYNTSVYVYVFSPTNLLRYTNLDHKTDESIPIIMVTKPNRPIVFPCRPTHPTLIKVTLRKTTFKKSIPGTVYDPEVGFTVARASSLFNYGFYCVAKYKTETTKHYFKLHYEDDAEPLNPVLTASNTQVWISKTFTIECVALAKHLPCPRLIWEHTITEKSRVSHTKDACRETSQGRYRYIVTSVLTVKDARVADSMTYGCKATYRKWQKTSQIAIRVLEKTYVTLSTKSQFEANEGDQYKYLLVDVDANPAPEIKWYKDGHRIVSDSHIKIIWNSDQAVIQITKLTRADTGMYRIVAHTANQTAEESMYLLVKYPPTAQLVNNTDVIFKNGMMPYGFRCNIDGEPKPTLAWKWTLCVKAGCELDTSSTWETPDRQARLLGGNDVTVSNDGHLSLQNPTQSGWLQCMAIVGNDSHSDYTRVIVSDMPRYLGFDIEDNEFSPVEGDRVVVNCKGNIWMYRSVKLKTKSLTNGRDVNSTGISSQSRNMYSHISSLTFPLMKLSDSVVYACIGISVDGTAITDEENIIVQKMVAPYFKVTPTSGRVSQDPGSVVTFDCNVLGLPPPDIVWVKDGRVLSVHNKSNIKFVNVHKRLRILNVTSEDAGTYGCIATNRAGNISSNISLLIGVTPATISNAYVAIIMGVILGAIVTSVLVILFVRHRLRLNMLMEFEDLLLQPKGKIDPDIPLEEQTDALPYDQKYEFPRDRLRMGKILGQGAFGRVVQAEAVGILDSEEITNVAIKMVKDCRDREQMNSLMSELKILIHVEHHVNIVNLLGAVTKNIKKGELYVIVEFCEFGSLRSHLIKYRDEFVATMDDGDNYLEPVVAEGTDVVGSETRGHQYVNKASTIGENLPPPPLTLKNLMSYSYQVARGMEYLTMKNLVHRDLAARNVLLGRGNIAKICDFGLAKECLNDEYQKKGAGPVPVKWLAVESLTHKLYSTKSDVWSFGVFLWEMFSLGGNPYPGIAIDETFITRIKNGYRMEKPDNAPDTIYAVMLNCWHKESDRRPSFNILCTELGDLLAERVKDYYLDLSADYHDPVVPDDNEETRDGFVPNAVSNDGYLFMGESEDEVTTPDKQRRLKNHGGSGINIEMIPLLMQEKDENRSHECPTNATKKKGENFEESILDDHGYLLPKVEIKHNARKPETEQDSTRSNASSGFHSDYLNEYIPPKYDQVVSPEV